MGTLIWKLLQRLFPLAEAQDPRALPETTLSVYRSMSKKSALIYMPLAAISAAGWWFVLSTLHQAIGATWYPVGPGDQLIVQGAVYWMLPALLLGSITPAPPIEWFQARTLGRDYAGYQRYEAERYGVDSAKLTPYVLWGLLAVCLIFSLLGWNHFVVVKSDRLAMSGYFNPLSRVREFASITRIKTAGIVIAPNGNRVERREYVIHFASGDKWSTNNAPTGLTAFQKAPLMARISAASGIPIDEVDALDD
jgi:hypothetical protein